MAERRRTFVTAPITIVVLIVGAGERFVDRFRIAAAPRKAQIFACDSACLRDTARHRVPRTLLVPRSVRVRAEAELEAMAREVCARVVEFEDESMDDAALDELTLEALRWA